MNLIEIIAKEQRETLSTGKNLPKVEPGDTVKLTWRLRENNILTQRTQIITGTVIKKVNKGVMSSITLNHTYQGGWVSVTLPLYSPLLQNIEIVKRAKVRRAKLYYLVGRTGKAARLKERKK